MGRILSTDFYLRQKSACDNLWKLIWGDEMPATAKNRTAFASRLLQIRKAKGLTQIELSNLSGVSRRVVALYETKIKGPSADVVLRLAKALDVSVDQLMGIRPIKSKASISRKMFKDAKRLEELPPKDRKAVLQMIEALSKRKNP